MALNIDRLTLTPQRTSVAYRPDGLTVSGWADPDQLGWTANAATRSQWLALNGAAVPVWCPEDPDLDGYYRAESIEITPTGLIGGVTFLARVDVELKRLGSTVSLEVESHLSGAALVPGQATWSPQRWVSPAATAAGFFEPAYAWQVHTRPVATGGTIDVYRGLAVEATPRWHVTPANYYAGAAQLYDSANRPLIGTDPPIAAGWKIGTGVLELVHQQADWLRLRAWNGSAWVARDFRATGSLTAGNLQWGLPTVLRNDPEEVILRFTTTTGARYTWDVAVRRGSRYVSTRLQTGSSQQLTVAHASPQASTTLAGGIVSTSATNTVKWVLATPLTGYSDNTTAGNVHKTNVTSFPAMIGAEVGSAAGDLALDVVNQYAAGQAEVQTLVRR